MLGFARPTAKADPGDSALPVEGSELPRPAPTPVPATTAVAGAEATPIWPPIRLDKLPPVMLKFCEPVCSITPRLLVSALALISIRRAFSVPPVLSIAAGVLSRNSWALDIKPLLPSGPVSTTCASVVLWIEPELVSQPSFLTISGPELVPIFPALFTPTPASVPISVIRPAYIPPKFEASRAKCGRNPVPATGCVFDAGSLVRGSSSIRFAPVMTDNWFAQILALS